MNGKSLWETLLRHGPWTLLAFILVATLLGWIPGPIAAHIQRMERVHENLRGLTWATCMNAAQGNQEGEQRCESFWRPFVVSR